MRGIECDKLIGIITFINTKTDREGESNFSLNKLIRHCGLIPTKGAKGTINQFKNDLLKLVEVGLLEDVDNTIKNCSKGDSLITCKLNLPNLNSEFFDLNYSVVKEIL